MKRGQKPSGGRITIKTVAEDAGVSVAAVSKVMRNAYGVSQALRLKVQASIEKLGYRPSIAARGMRGQTFTIGLLLVDIGNPFLPQVIDGVNEVLAASNYRALIGVGQSRTELEASLLDSMISYHMDGLILVAPQLQGAKLAHYAKQLPMVVIGHHEPTATAFDTVNSDDQEGAALAVRSFLKAGLTDIAMLSFTLLDTSAANVVIQREIGFMKAMVKLGLPGAQIERLPLHQVDKPAAVKAYLQREKLPRALFCWSDLDALLVMDAAKQLGLRVPEDLAVIGYDNSSPAALAPISLSSIDQSGKRLGSLAAENLVSRIAGRSVATHLLIEPNLVSRRSH